MFQKRKISCLLVDHRRISELRKDMIKSSNDSCYLDSIDCFGYLATYHDLHCTCTDLVTVWCGDSIVPQKPERKLGLHNLPHSPST